MRRLCFLVSILLSVVALESQAPPTLSPGIKPFVTIDAPVFILTHVRVIDGTGAPAREDQAIIVSAGKIQAIGDAAGHRLLPEDLKGLRGGGGRGVGALGVVAVHRPVGWIFDF